MRSMVCWPRNTLSWGWFSCSAFNSSIGLLPWCRMANGVGLIDYQSGVCHFLLPWCSNMFFLKEPIHCIKFYWHVFYVIRITANGIGRCLQSCCVACLVAMATPCTARRKICGNSWYILY
jgi:hypothetical protein